METNVHPEIPTYKYEKGLYKKAMKEAFAKTDIVPPLGGVEYGEEIALNINFYTAQRADSSFKHFRDELRAALQPFA